MNHTIMPVTAHGEPIPLVKLGQGREETGSVTTDGSGAYPARGSSCFTGSGLREEMPQTLAAKLRAAGYQEPVLPSANMNVPSCDFCGHPMGSAGCKSSHKEGAMVFHSVKPEERSNVGDLPLVSQRGFKAGVFSACLGGAFLAALYLGAGSLICGCVASGCVGFVAGMLMTEDWK